MPNEILRALLRLVETNKDNQTSPAVSSGKERGLVSRTAAGNRAYFFNNFNFFKSQETVNVHCLASQKFNYQFASKFSSKTLEKRKQRRRFQDVFQPLHIIVADSVQWLSQSDYNILISILVEFY